MDYAVRYEGLDELLKRLDTAHPLVQRELLRAMTRAVHGELGRMPAYPVQRAGSSYRRTGLLGRSLTGLIGSAPGAASEVQTVSDGVQGVVGTAVGYGPQVIGRQQAPAHAGRWWMLESVVMSHATQINAEFAEAGTRIADALGD